jgi:hypothetical protein
LSFDDWREPDVPDAGLAYAFGSSVVEQFAQGHTAADVLRELVQNEYDARGSTLSVTFGHDGLAVRGSGRVIDRPGWRRLSVLMGTGRVVGEGREVPQKANGIGSKNFGLRSLFVIGDRIYVRSGGLQTFLDLRRGAPRAPLPDETSMDLSGAHVFVGYRDVPEGLLEVYDATREARDVDLLADELAPTLLKLADPKAPRSLRSVTVSSVRQGRVLRWKQRVALVRRHRLGGALLQRTIELRDERSGSDSVVTRRTTELEYQRAFVVPAEHRARSFPDYFRVSGGRVRIGVSMRITRKRPDPDGHGAFYYPLGLARGGTGCGLSINGPFELDSDRSELVDPGISSWNRWLLETVADFALDLLTAEWLDSFGAAGYLVLEQRTQPSIPFLADKLTAGLAERECWPTRARENRSRRPKMSVAAEIKLGVSPQLDVLFSDTRRLDERLVGPRVLAMARRAGAKDFTLASAIRLRCAGKGAEQLSTKVGSAANLYFDGFPDALQDLDRQERFGTAFDSHRRELTPSNRVDLTSSPTTLTAAGTLAAPTTPLWVVDDDIAPVAPVKPDQRLHPRLARYATIKGLCKPFDMSAWARQVATEASAGTVDDDDREALYRYLLRAPETITRPTWATIRTSPVVMDHHGAWACASEMVQRRTAGAARIEAALQFPSADMRNQRLLRSLRIRSKLTGADIVRQARIVAEQPEMAEDFEEALHRLRSLLTQPTIKRLGPIAFLRSTKGGLVAPGRCYVDTADLMNSVGPDVDFAAGTHTSLHERLGCQTDADADDVVRFLTTLREAGQAPARPEVLYPVLVEGLRVAGDVSRLAEEPILCDGGAWHAPAGVLLGQKHRQIFEGALPVVVAGSLAQSYEALGASREPKPEHWLRFFEWIDGESGDGTSRLNAKARKAVALSYSKLGSLPDGVSDRAHVLLDSNGFVHSQVDARTGRFLINDDPAAARIIAEQLVPVAFAVRGDAATRRFLRASGVLLLTEARRYIGSIIGDVRAGPPWFRESVELDRLQRPAFASSVHAVAAMSGSRTVTSETSLRRVLRSITQLVFVTSVDDSYRVGRIEFNVPGDVSVDGSRIVLRFVRSKSELHGHLARAVSRLAESTEAQQQPLADSVFRILSCESVAEIERYLSQRGVVWSSRGEPESDLENDEEDEQVESRAQIGETLKEELMRAALRQGDATDQPPRRTRSDGEGELPSDDSAPKRTLPALEEVELNEVRPPEWTPTERQGGSGGGGGGGWRLRSAAEQEADRAFGERGEELVYQREVERVVAMDRSPDLVTWTSKTDPAADHDIHSVADDGGDLWLEVKSTTGRHGRFDWSRAEFELAIKARESYVLCRVYEVDSKSPKLLRETDPVGKFLRGDMRLDMASLAAEVAPLLT